MGILSKILGSTDVLSKGLDLIDDMHTSDTEAIEAKTKAKTQLLSSYAPFKVAQRYLALIFAFTFVGSYLMVCRCSSWTRISVLFMSLYQPSRSTG